MNLGITLIKIGSLYLLIGLALGLGMAISGSYVLSSAHAHVTLLGWAAMSSTGLVYLVLPRCAESRWARLHFWLHNIGLPVMMISLGFHAYGYAAADKFLGAGSVLVFLALVLFTINLYRHAGVTRTDSD